MIFYALLQRAHPFIPAGLVRAIDAIPAPFRDTQLDFLRMYSADARSSGAGASEGLSEAQMTTLGEVVWRPGGEVGRGGDDLCSVCLGEFMEGDAVRCLPVSGMDFVEALAWGPAPRRHFLLR